MAAPKRTPKEEKKSLSEEGGYRLQVRLGEAIGRLFGEVIEQYGLNESTLVKALVRGYLEAVEREGNPPTLPFQVVTKPLGEPPSDVEKAEHYLRGKK